MACQRLSDALAAVWGGSPPEPGVLPQVERGPPGWVLVSIAGHSGDVLVIGAGHGGPVRRAARCRAVRYCVARARCPAVLVPAPQTGCRARPVLDYVAAAAPDRHTRAGPGGPAVSRPVTAGRRQPMAAPAAAP